jgi:hypothetical protein
LENLFTNAVQFASVQFGTLVLIVNKGTTAERCTRKTLTALTEQTMQPVSETITGKKWIRTWIQRKRRHIGANSIPNSQSGKAEVNQRSAVRGQTSEVRD